MKRIILFLTLASMIFAQDVQDGEIDQTTPVSEEGTPVVTETEDLLDGKADVKSAPKPSADRRNWIFAAGSITAAALAIFFVSLNPGDAPPRNP